MYFYIIITISQIMYFYIIITISQFKSTIVEKI